jgi:outer membrane lipoprotein carrier protein
VFLTPAGRPWAWLALSLLVLVRPAAADPTPTTAKPSPEAQRVVRAVQQRYDETTDFTADVTQEMNVASLGKTLTAHGTIAFMRPGKLRWQLNDGSGQVIVADGTTLWLYQPEEQQVLKAPFQSAFRASTPISFLLGVGRIADDFDVSLDQEPTAAEPLLWLKLIPRQSDGTIGWLRLGVIPKTFDIAAAEIHDQLGNVTRLQFHDLRRDVKLDDSLFHFKVPDGVDVVEAPIGF